MARKGRPDAGTAVPETSPSPLTGAEPQTITIPVVLPLNQHARVWMLLSGVLGIMLIAALVIIGYLWNVNGAWQDQVTSLTATGYDLGDRIAEHKEEIAKLESTNALLSDQLSTVKDKLLTLSNEKAQWSDQTAYAQQQVDLLSDQVDTAQDVIAQLGRCVDGEMQLQTYLADTSGTFPPEQIDEYSKSVSQLCTSALTASTSFQQSITR